MLRQRLRTRTSPLVFVGRLLVLLFAGALLWYGLMTVLLAFKVAPSTVDQLSGYRTALDWLAGLTPGDVDGPARAIGAVAGILACLVFGYLAYQELPRPYLARQEVELDADDRGDVRVEPLAIERVAEIAARQEPGVSAATSSYERDDLTLNLTVQRARGVADVLRGAQARVRAALAEHGLPSVPVTVTLTGYDRKHRRELS
jgi:hypothetical protein